MSLVRKMDTKCGKLKMRGIMEKTKASGVRFLNLLGVAICSFCLPGLGHFTCGKIKKAIIVYIASQFLIVTAFFVFVKTELPYNLILFTIMILSIFLYAIIDSVHIARNPINTLKFNPLIGYFIIVAILSFQYKIASEAIRDYLIDSYEIASDTMYPTLLDGDVVLVEKQYYVDNCPKRGDIVLLQSSSDPSKKWVMRIAGLEGEKVEIKNTKVRINNLPYKEAIETVDDKMSHNIKYNTQNSLMVPDNSYFVIDDNQANNTYSQFWGIVARKNANGKVAKIYWSWDRNKRKFRWDRIGMNVK
jgi:signal peptidase I